MQKRTGFTLIELLVVIAIIAILAAVAIIQFGSAQADARDARRQADVRAMQSAVELYYNENNTYPTTDGSGTTDTWTTVMEDLQSYLASPIQDPLPGSNSNSSAIIYYCTPTSAKQHYIITADLEAIGDVGGDVDTEGWLATNADCELSTGAAGVDGGAVVCTDNTGGFCIGDPDPTL